MRAQSRRRRNIWRPSSPKKSRYTKRSTIWHWRSRALPWFGRVLKTLICKETAIGDLRIWCAARSKQMTVHYDSKKLLITVKNTGRLEHEKDVILHIEGYRTGADRADRNVHLVRNEQPVNIDMLIVGELRVLTGLSRQRGT